MQNPLQAAGFIAAVNLKTIAYRTALTGGASYLDIFVLAPGIHTQQAAVELNNGEFPITSAMTTGYVFRVENQATVSFLQMIGKTGHLTTVHVSHPLPRTTLLRTDILASLLYVGSAALTVAAIGLLVAIKDWWALEAVGALMLARLMNVLVIKRRSSLGWKGAKEVGEGDLLVLLSQDRWVRIQGAIDDLKTVTAGSWLREMTAVESCVVNVAIIFVYVSAILAFNASLAGNLLLVGTLVLSLGLVGLANAATKNLCMFNHVLKVHGTPKGYNRRRDMALELIAERSGSYEWAVRLGLVVDKPAEVESTAGQSAQPPSVVEV